jgi:hypothetical protein
MNVTLKLPDDLCRAAKHRAVDQSKSLSQWMADLVRRELGKTEKNSPKPRTWMDAFSGDADDGFLDRDFPLPDRKSLKAREVNLKG